MSEDLVRDLYSEIEELKTEINKLNSDNYIKEMIIQTFEQACDIERSELMESYVSQIKEAVFANEE